MRSPSADPPPSPPLCYTRPALSVPARAPRALLIAAILVAFALRLPVGGVPPGLYHDEAYYGLDAVSVLAGHPALYFPANNGREPLFIHLAAAFVALLGRTPAALRLASAFVGVASVAAAWAAVRILVGTRAGLLAAWLFAVAPWPVLLGRAGFRAGTLPLVLALAVAVSVPGWRRGDRRLAILGGALGGLTLYTYTAARAVPVAFVLGGLWLWWREGGPGRAWCVRWLAAGAVVVAPLAAYFALHQEHVLTRLGEVAITNPDVGGGQPGAALWSNLAATAGMLAARGDFIPRHNIPLRPVFGPGTALLALLGVATALLWARRRPGLGLLLIWVAVMALPTLLAANAPHFLRAVGRLPAILALPALGAEAVAGLVARFRPTWARPLWAGLLVLVVAGELWATVDYLRRADVNPGSALYDAFETGAAELARDVNTTLGAGWRGGWTDGVASAGRPVWLERRLRDGWAAVPYLVPETRVTLVDRYDPILTTVPGVAYLQPVDLDLDGLWSRLAPNARLRFDLGAMERADLAEEASRLYVRVTGDTATPVAAPLAQFANGMRLLAADVRYDGPDALEIETVWDAVTPVSGQDVTAFFQLLHGRRMVVTDDAPLGSGLYPTPRWRPGDQIVERRRLAAAGGPASG